MPPTDGVGPQCPKRQVGRRTAQAQGEGAAFSLLSVLVGRRPPVCPAPRVCPRRHSSPTMARDRLLPAPAAARRLSVLALLILCITAWNLSAASAASADAGSGAKDWSNEKQGVHVLNVTNFDSSLRDGKVWLIEVRRLFLGRS